MKTTYSIIAIASLLCCSCGTTTRLADSQPIEEPQIVNDNGSYSTNKLEVDDKEIVGYSNIFDYMRGKVPGVQIGNAAPGSMPSVTIRGASSFNSSTQPLFILDGGEVSSIAHISPNDIDSIEVLKDASTSLYGVRGANGVIIIKTKTAKEAAIREAEAKKEARAAKKAARKTK